MIFRLILEIAAFYALVVVFVYFYQRNLQYFPDRSKPGTPKANDVPEMSIINIKTADGLDLVAWFAPPRQKGGKIVVLFHGNAGNLAGRAIKARYFIDRGYGCLLCEYRGFGGNPGRPTEQGLYHDARGALKWLEDNGYIPAQLVIYGESIGTGVAVQVASEIQPRQLILEAPFASAVEIAKRSYPILPVDWMMHDRYDSIGKIGKVHCSLLIVHGDEDPVIPIDSGKRLFDAANHPKEFCAITGGGHSDLYDHHAGHIISDWLDLQVEGEKRA
ncbi:MAG: alpha/beta hydrolase [Alphaproteobacteria bacterium]|nr:MAG: alpha/beta hydrolase [Alphaproteobacteria bacterium]